jgi:hypothetical protein
MASAAHWDALLNDLSNHIDNTPHKMCEIFRKLFIAHTHVFSTISDAEYAPLVNALDRLIDEIKSGEDHKQSNHTAAIVKQLVRCLAYPNWNLVQTIVYAVSHLFKDSKLCEKK